MSHSLTGEGSLDSLAERGCAELTNALHTSGTEILRVTKNYKLKKVVVSFSSTGDGLQYLPASDKNSSVFFAHVQAARALPADDPVCRKAHLGHFQHCLQMETRLGWSWYLVCSTELDRSIWIELLEQRRRQFVEESRTNVADAWVTQYWAGAAVRGKTRLTFNEVSAVFRSVFGHIPAEDFAEAFRFCDSDNDAALNYDDFHNLFRRFSEVNLVKRIYDDAGGTAESGMSAEAFTRFCSSNDGNGESGPALSPMRCAGLFQLFTNRQVDRMNLSVFTAFLFHPRHNSAVDQRQLFLVDSMDFPINCYFINSSHNTYLTGNQLNSDSSCAMYREVLQAGCRCVEIDCWDGPDGQPIVYHGHTMTSKVSFQKAIQTINAHAFESLEADGGGGTWNPREFPVILSLEVHTCTEQTNQMATIMRDIFQERLFLSDLNPESYTPAKLKNKILVKWRMNAAGVEEVKDTTGSGIRLDRRVPTGGSGSSLSACASVGSVKTSTWGEEEKAYHVESYSENDVYRIGNTAPVRFLIQNSRMLSRTYPAGTRIDSSNYDPMPMWRLGCHMVALNWQTRDQAMRVNEGFFTHQNGGCGYVLKPPLMRDVGTALLTSSYAISVRVICGSHLHTTFDGVEGSRLSTRVWLHGDPSVFDTEVVAAGLYTQWNEVVRFRGSYKDLDVLCLQVLAHTSGGSTQEVCSAYVPVRVLRVGHHAMPLRHAKGGHMAGIASVLVHVAFEESKASQQSPSRPPTEPITVS